MADVVTRRWVVAVAVTVALAALAATATTRPTHAQQVTTKMRFPLPKHVKKDDWPEFANAETPPLKRWDKEPNTTEHDLCNMEERVVVVRDVRTAPRGERFDVRKQGFERVDLHPRLLPILRRIKHEGLSGNRVGPTLAGAGLFSLGGDLDETVEDSLARALQGFESFSLGDGQTVHYALRCTGFVIRKGGPEGAKLAGVGFDNVAHRVHIDQDLQGEPLRNMKVDWVFKLPFMHLLNVWSPLDDVHMRPLAFADQRTVVRERDVLRYRTNSTANAGGRFGSFRSDRLMPLYHASHEWWWFPNTKFGQALAFDTGSVPHSSFSMPGEELLGKMRDLLMDVSTHGAEKAAACTAAGSASADAVLASVPAGVVVDTEALLGASRAFLRRACQGRASKEDMDEMLELLSRASLEIRCVTLIMPRQVALAAAVTVMVVVAGLAASVARVCASLCKRSRGEAPNKSKVQ